MTSNLKKVLSDARKEFDKFESSREILIKNSRDILKASKSVIYELHRNNVKSAETKLSSLKKDVQKFNNLAKNNLLYCTGSYHEALEEFVEAVCFFHFLNGKPFPSFKELGVDFQVYLQGVCDFTGELVRKAVNDAINDDTSNIENIRSTISNIYDELLLFDWRNTPLRRKFDSIKYGLEKLNDLSIQINFSKR